jgi:predicted DNA-binding transcriptional regulator YafY
MSAYERRAEIIKILEARRKDNVSNLASSFGVSIRTIKYDIEALMVDYPIETVRGNGGCVKVADWYRPHKNILNQEQQIVLIQLMDGANAHQQKILREMLVEFGSPDTRKQFMRD